VSDDDEVDVEYQDGGLSLPLVH